MLLHKSMAESYTAVLPNRSEYALDSLHAAHISLTNWVLGDLSASDMNKDGRLSAPFQPP